MQGAHAFGFVGRFLPYRHGIGDVAMFLSAVHQRACIDFLRVRGFLLFFLTIVLGPQTGGAASVRLAWDANQDADLAGYRVYVADPPEIPADWTEDQAAVVVWPYMMKDPDHPGMTLEGLAPDRSYCFSVTAFNAAGEESDFSNTVRTIPLETQLPFLFGEVSATHEWKPVRFPRTYQNPVVVTGPPGTNAPDGVVVRLDRIDANGFAIRVQEWGYHDGEHIGETVGYLAAASGRCRLPDGGEMEAGEVSTRAPGGDAAVSFARPFSSVPVVMTSVCTTNNLAAVTVRVSDVTVDGFRVQLQQQELNAPAHAAETVSFIAWEVGQWQGPHFSYAAGLVPGGVTDLATVLALDAVNGAGAVLLAGMQTCRGGNPAVVRWLEKSDAGIVLYLSEEQSSDSETRHIAEAVGFLLLSRSAP